MSTTKYSQVNIKEQEDEEENDTLLDDSLSKTHPESQLIKRRQPILPWIIASISTALFLASLALNILHWTRAQQDTRCIFSTDLPDARRAIEYEKLNFTGALHYVPETKLVVRDYDAPIEYFGPPSEELDQRWEDMLRGEFPLMTEEEAAPYKPELRPFPGTNDIHFEPDFFHSLHCLNAVRKQVSISLYPALNLTAEEHPNLPPGWDVAHMEHCMDRLRQAITCAGDLTPSPMYWWDGFALALGRSGEHTCRRWGRLREWMDERGEMEAAPLDDDEEEEEEEDGGI